MRRFHFAAAARTCHRVAWLAVVCWFLLSGASLAAESLASRLRPLIDAHEGQVAVAVKHLDTGEEFQHRADEPMPTASLIKVAVLVEAYRQAEAGRLDLDEAVTLRAEDKVPGSGILTSHFSPGAKLPLRDCLRLMIAYSDNTATNLVLDRTGLKPVNNTMERLGLPHTKIHAKVFRRNTSIAPERSRKFGLGSTTAAEMVRLLDQLHRGELVSAEASGAMLEHLHACQDADRLPKLLPDGARVAHKTGSVSAVRTDAGIVFTSSGPIAVCILTNENKDRRWTAENAGTLLCARVGKTIYDHFQPSAERDETPPPAQLAEGATGELVEALQRTLNARLSPSPELSIDGEFGAVTRAAVVRFQQEQKLAASGVVGRETWQALGPLLTGNGPVPDPAVVNAETLETRPADPLAGPPFVTATAWAVADAKTGEILWSDRADRRLDMASTTKIMTALVVLTLAESDSTLLDDDVVFSRRADETPGSTSGLRAGERVPVRELLYGLLLPSGNDASMALAEHFGLRCAPPETIEAGGGNGNSSAVADADPLDRFVAEMNRTAARLGLQDTRYANPHGLTAADHRSSARDLVRLAWTAMRNPTFCDYVCTRQRGVTVTGPGGYQRNVVWKNTNRLLPIDGYEGVKTGTTTAAGACLVSRGTRGEDGLIVVVLGASSSDGRYVDTRNLFRWAWLQRGHGPE
jgi:serine-type D-Ala-D-Ala carboxypeptidase (penicillin-binding protein 5/6)